MRLQNGGLQKICGIDGLIKRRVGSKSMVKCQSRDTLLAPSLTAYFDMEQQGGCYLELGLGHSFSLPYNTPLDLAGALGYSIDEDGTDDGYYDDNGFTHAQATATLSYSPLPHVTLAPFVSVQLCIDDKVKNQDDVGKDVVVWGGLTVKIEF